MCFSETDYANWKAGAAKLNTDEGVYANLKAKEQTAQGNHNDSKKGLYENTEPVLKPKKHKWVILICQIKDATFWYISIFALIRL